MSRQGRDIKVVIDAMLKEIPAGEQRFMGRLNAVSLDSNWKAPECHHLCWHDLMNVLEERFPYGPHLDIPWTVTIFEIFSDRRKVT